MNSNLKRLITASLYVIAGVALLFVIVPIPINIETYALEIVITDPSHVEERKVRIRGWYSFNFLVDWHEFRGTIEITGHPETNSPLFYPPLSLSSSPFEPRELRGVRGDLLFYESMRAPSIRSGTRLPLYDVLPFGAIRAKSFFREALIAIANEDGGINFVDCRIVVLNATTREEALVAARRLIPAWYIE